MAEKQLERSNRQRLVVRRRARVVDERDESARILKIRSRVWSADDRATCLCGERATVSEKGDRSLARFGDADAG